MKKRFAALVLFLMLIQLQMTVSATESSSDTGSASAVSAYCMGNTLYSFVQIDGYDARQLNARTDLVGGGMAEPVLITESDSEVTYILLIDNSGSMKKYASEAASFASALIEHETQDVEFILITFGEQVLFNESVNTVDCLDRAAVKNVVLNTINSLDYSEDWTNTYAAITSVMDYLDKNYPGKEGDLVNLILITDGEPDLEDKTVEETEAEAAMKRIAETPEVVLHTISFQEWNTEHIIPQGTGVDIVVGEGADAAMAAKSIANFVDGIYRIDFTDFYGGKPVPERSEVSYYLSNSGEEGDTTIELIPISMEGVPVMVASGDGWMGPAKEESDVGGHDAETGLFTPENPGDVEIIFAEEAEEETTAVSGSFQRGIIIGAACCAIVIVIVLAAVKLLGQQRRESKAA